MTEDDEQNDFESENLIEVSSGESNEEFSEEILSHPPSDDESDCSEHSSEELDEEGVQGPSKESDSEQSEGIAYKTEQPVEILSKEEEVEQTEETFEESYSDDGYDQNEHSSKKAEGKPCEEPFDVSQLPFGTINNDIDYQLKSVPTNSNEKKRSLDAKDGDNHLAKKCKPGQSLGPKTDVGSAPTPQKTSEISKACSNAVNASERQEQSGGSGKRRRSRWEPQPELDVQGGECDNTSKRRKTRWAADDSQLKMLGPLQLPDFMKKLVETDLDPEIQELKKKLSKINRWLQRAEVHDDRSRVERSPSPPPVNDEFGIRLDPRDVRFHEKLVRDRQDIIARLIEKNPTFKPPPDYMPRKLCKRLYIPLKEYPEYNFIGLIIGPRGHTQKRMEKETGARIMLRGVGCSLKDKKPQQKPDPFDDEDLHVLIEADNQKALDDAVGMVEKLLIPVDEGMNEHKRAQLRELAVLNGNVKDDKLCSACGKEGHMRYSCPNTNSILNSDLSCNTCGGSSHFTANCPLTMSTPGSNLANQQKTFLADLGGVGGFTFNTPQNSSCIPWQGGNTEFGISPSYGSNTHSGPGSTPTTDGQSSKEVDNANMIVRYLPQTVDDNRLRELFTHFGRLIEAKVIKDRTTGCSKGYGFVKYDNPINAATAMACMNGHKIDGKVLAVKVSAKPPTAVSSSTSRQPWHRGNPMVSQNTPSPVSWPGPPGSMLSDHQLSSTKSNDFGLPHSSVFFGHTDSSIERLPSLHHLPKSSPSSLAQFPGNPDYPRSQYSYFTPPSSSSPQLSLTQSSSSSITPFSWTPCHPPGNGPFHRY